MDNKLNCLVLEDGKQSQQYIKELIQKHPSLELLDVCENENTAANVLGKKKVDLFFLDIELEEGRGDKRGLNFINILKNLSKEMPHIIITSKSKDYALEAFDLSAIDYLHKPFTENRFNESIQKILNNMKNVKEREFLNITTVDDKDGRGFTVIPINEIVYFETDNDRRDHIKVWRKSNKIQTPMSYTTRKYVLKDFENLTGFVRIHNSYIVRKSYIDKVFRADMFIRLRDNQRINIGTTYLDNLREFWEDI